MAFAFNGAAKTISFTGGALSVREMWSRYIDWLETGDNSKYLPMLRTVGMDTPDIPFYVFLELGVTLVVTNTLVPTVVGDGVIKTDDSRDPFGGAVVNVRYEAPGIAIGYSTTGGTAGPSTESIAAATVAAMMAQAQITPIHSDMRKAVGQLYHGDGSEGNKLRSTLVP